MGNGLSDYSSAAFQIHFDLVAINHASKASHCMRVEFHLISTWLQGFFLRVPWFSSLLKNRHISSTKFAKYLWNGVFFYGYPGFPPFLKTDISHQQNSLSIYEMGQRSIDTVDPWKFYYLGFGSIKKYKQLNFFSDCRLVRRQNNFSLRSGVSAL